jgi:outer membrane protein assembly factor BamB
VLGFGNVYFLTGFGKGQLIAVKLPDMKNWSGTPAVLSGDAIPWRAQKGMPSKPSMLLVDDLVYTISDAGIAVCMDAKTGQEIWRQRVQGNYSSSPIYAEGHIYVCSEEGKVSVLATGREFKLAAENHLDDGIMASPAVSGKALYLRTKTNLYRIEQ